MADVNANIGINFDTSNALAQLRQLQAGLSRFNQALTQGNVAAMNAQKGLNSQLMQAINATGKFVASQKEVATSTSSFTSALEKNQLSMKEYFRYTAAAATANTKTFNRMFQSEREIINRARKDRVKLLQSQYVQMGAASGDLVKVLQVIPKHLQMAGGQYTDYATRMQMAAQRQQFLNQLLKQGSTQLLNFGKNTQWAGRQLMVGLTIPLTLLGSMASKTFLEMEAAVLKFTRVYGDLTTSGDATNRAVADIQRLGKEFTKYGIAVKDTVEMAADAAAMGLTGSALQAQVIQATRLAVLGQVEQQQALETTISLTNAFGLATDELAGKINFLNAVENQTVLSIEDLTIAIPKAGPVVKQLGGSVEDLAFFMTAMKEGGINASEGANALKSGLASMINPAKKTSEFLAGLGINIKGIVDNNAGDLKGTVVGFARALDTLDPLNRARAIEQMFGKFQFARLSTLFQNVTKDTSQAARALGLAGSSVEELAILSERELKRIEDSTGAKFKKAMENIKTELVPVGKAFLEAVTPIVAFVGRILEKFNGLSDGTKKIVTIIIATIGGLAPIALMTFGILANGVANLIKFFAMLRGGIAKLNGSNQVLGGGFDYLTNQQIENLAETNALHTSHSQLISTFNVEKAAVDSLAAAYGNASSQARALASSSPGLFNTVPGPAGAVSGLPPKKFAQGGVVPGTGNKDTVPALLTPGEVVITKQTAKENPELVAALQNGSVKRYNEGTGRVVTGDQRNFISQVTSRSSNAASVADEIGKQFEFINKASTEKLIAYARATGRTVSDTSEETLEQLRESLVSNVKRVIEAAAQAAREKGKELTAAGAASATKKVGTAGPDASLHQFYNPRAKQQESQQFSHVETSTSVPIDQLSRTVTVTNEKTQSELLNLQRAIEESNRINGTNVAMPTASPVSGFGYELQGQINKAMNDESPEIKNFKGVKGNTVSTIDAFLENFEETGVTKWQKAIEIGGGNFEQLSGSLREYDNQLLQAVREWKQNNPGKAFTDTDFKSIEQTIRSRVAGLDTELGQVFDVARQTVTAIRVSMDKEQRAIANADVIARGETNSKGQAYTQQNPKYGDRATYQAGGSEKRMEGGHGTFIAVSEEDRARATQSGATLGSAVIDGVRGESGTAAESPSKKGIKAGKEVADGLIIGMQEGQPAVDAQSAKLGNAAVPTAAETQAKVAKMDLGNKAFYDDIDTPEMRDQRQILKSQDRQRRKLGATGTVDAAAEIGVPSQTSSLIVSSTARSEAAAEQLAIKTEEAVTAQSQVVQQIKDESRSRVTVKGNTVNIGQARKEADRLDKEASDAEAAAARVRTEAAKWEEVAAREGGKNMYTADNAKALKKQADEIEVKAAELRIKAAEADIKATQLESGIDISEDDVKKPGKVQKIQDENNEIISNGTQEQGDGLKRIVEGTEDTAGSTLLVADQTDELATATGDAVNAQTQTAGNLLTGAQITSATTGNLNDVLLSTDQTGLAQQDIAESSQEIARRNEEIEEQKRIERDRLVKMNAEAAAADAANNGLIPVGEQSSNKYVDPDKAMGSVEAYEEASTYTRDKKGSILFDPETGQPTTLTKSQLNAKKRGMRKEKVGRVSGKFSGGLGTAAMVAGMAGAPPAVTGALGGAATVAQFAPMIAGMTGPQGIVAALAAVAAGAYLLNKKLEGTAIAIAKFTRTTTVSTDMLKKIGEQTGKVGASELMSKRRSEGQLQTYNEANRSSTMEATQFLEGDAGKALQAAFVSNSTKNGTEVAAQQFALQIAAAISDGTIAPELGQKIAYQMGINLKDSVAATRINVQLRKLIGPNGEDLGTDPLEIRARISQQASSLSEELVRKVNSDDRSEVGSNSMLSQIATLGMIGAASGSDKTAALAVASSSAVETAQAQADAMSLYYDEQLKTLNNELAATTNKQKQLEIQEKIIAMTAEQEAGMARMNNAVVAQIGRQTGYARDLIQSTTNTNSPFVTGFLNDDMRREDAFFDAQKNDVKAKFKGTAQEASAQRVLDIGSKMNARKEGFENEDEGQVFESKMNLMMQSGQLSPDQIETMAKIFSGDLKKMDTVLTVGMRLHGGAKMGELASILSGVDKKTAKTIMLRMSRKNPQEFKEVGNALSLLQASDGLEVDMQAAIELIGEKGLAQLGRDLAKIEELPDPIEKTGMIKFIEENPDMNLQGVIDNWEYYAALDPKVRKEAIQTYKTLFETATNFNTIAERDAWANIQAENAALLVADKGTKKYEEVRQTTFEALTMINGKPATLEQMAIIGNNFAQEGTEAKYRANSTIDSNPATGEGSGGGGDKKDPLDFLDDLAMRIKNVRDGAFDATKPLESMLAAFTSKKAQKDASRMFDIFDGLQQRLIGLNVPKEFRDIINGMSAEDFKELSKLTGKKAVFNFKKGKPRTKANIEGLTDTGRAVARTYREATLGDQNVINKETVLNIQNQEKAFRMLVSSGVSATDALNQVEDASLAAAIATGTLGKVGSPERKKYIDDLKKANSELERFNLKQNMIRKNEEFKLLEQMPKLMTAMKGAGMSADQMAAALEDPALAKHLIEDLKDGKVDAKDIADFLNSIEAKKIIDIQVKYNSGKYGEAAQPGIDAAEELFSALEAGIRNGVEGFSSAQNKIDVATLETNNKLIAKAELEAAGYRHQIELINREIRGMERDIEMNFTRPIEEASEAISDMERELEMNPLFGDRAIGKLNTENTKLSNDMAIMSNQAEKINERYDKQAEALQKVSDINAGIIAQQQSQLDLADALTQGDISAAARAMQASRADQASRNQTGVMDALEQARTNELEGLRGAESGLSQIQIAERQYEISQAIYKMENDPARLKIMENILGLQDKIYNFEEGREAALLEIRNKEDEIYKISKEQLWPLEDKIADMQHENDLAQRRLDIDVANLKVQGNSRAEFEKMKAEIALNEVAAKDLIEAFGGMLASVEAIRLKWVEVTAAIKASQDQAAARAVADRIAANAAEDEAEVRKDKEEAEVASAADDYAAAVAKGDMNAAALAAAKVGPSALAAGESGAIGAASIASQLAAAQAKLSGTPVAKPAPKPAPKPAAKPAPKPAAKPTVVPKEYLVPGTGVYSGSMFIPPVYKKVVVGSGGGNPQQYLSRGGLAIGTDTIPAMLTPGEFVMSRYAVQSQGIDNMKAINNGSSVGDSVYNYSINVNVESEANPDEIARVVMTQIRSIDSQKLRGTRI